MKNGSTEARKAAKGSFGGSIKVKRTINYKKEVFDKVKKMITGVEPAKATVGRHYKGSANSKLVKKLHRSSSLF